MRIPNPVRRIGGRIFISFTVLLVALTSLMSFVGLQFAQRTISANAANELSLLSIVLSRQVQRQLNRVEQSLTSMENHGFLIAELKRAPPDRAAVEDFLQKRLRLLPLFDDIAVFTKQGVCLGSTDPSWYEMSAKQKPFFINGLRRFNFSDIYTSDQGKVQLVSTPITNGSVTKGVLVGQVNMSSIYDLMDQKLGLSDSTDAFLLDSAFHFITPGKTGIDRLLQSHLIAPPLIKHLKEEFWVDQYKNFSGREVLGTVSRVPGRRWYIVVERDLAEVSRPINDAKKVIGLVSAVLIVALIITTYLLTRSITKPLMVLVEGTQRIARGDFKQPFKVPGGIDEVSFLASEFDKMRARIAAFQEQLIEKLEESERKRLENERLAAIGTLASTLAHEIRNPLNGMSLLVTRLELANRGVVHPQGGVLRDLRGEIARLDRLVSDILDYAKPLHLHFRDIDLRKMIEGTVQLYRGVLDERGIDCRVVLSEPGLKLRADSDRLKQCLVNLLANAIDAVPDHGLIEIEARPGGDDFIEIFVRDEGAGLPPEAAGRIFDLFFTTKDRGTGLGLSTVKKIVDAHGGQITIANRSLLPDAEATHTGSRGTEVRLTFGKNSYL